MPLTRLVDKTGNGRSEGLVEMRARKCSGFIYVNEGQKLNKYRVSLAEKKKKRKKKEKSGFLTACGSVGRWPFWTFKTMSSGSIS